MTHRPNKILLSDKVFCCDGCTQVDTRHSDKPYHDPNKQFHQAVYQSFLDFANRLSTAKDLDLVQAHEAAQLQRQNDEIYAAAISVQEERDTVSMTLVDMIRSYNPDQKTTSLAPPPSLASTKSPATSSTFTSAFTLPSSPPFSPAITPPRQIISQDCSSFRSFSNSNAAFGLSLATPPPSKPNSKVTSISSGIGQSFMDFLRNGVTALPSSGVPNLGSSITDSKIPEWTTRLTTQAMQPLAQSFTPPGKPGLDKSSKSAWAVEPGGPSSHMGTFGPFRTSTTTETLEPFRFPNPNEKSGASQVSTPPASFADISFDDFRTVQTPYWTQTEPEPFVPQRVLSPSNMINNPLLTNPPPTYVIHITSRQDYGKTESHRYFVCPADLTSDWPEVSLLQWFAAGVGYDVKAEKWDHKCLKHQRFFRMVLRPNLAMREWGLGKPLEELQAELAKLSAVAATKGI